VDIRSFIAFEQPEAIRGFLRETSSSLIKSRLDVRWVKPENIHLTIVFLGNVSVENLSAMERPIGVTCGRHRPFPISLKGLGCFPNARSPRVLWLGLEGDAERMGRLRDELQAGLVPFGIEAEKRPFRPHLTLGRFNRSPRGDRELERVLGEHEGLSSPSCTIEELVLFKSDLRRGGSIYTKLKSWPFTGSQ
jgi:RNA 2',3'-cyclic 3'-phosphodiesterase